MKNNPKIYVELHDVDENTYYSDWIELNMDTIDSWNQIGSFIDKFGGFNYENYIITDSVGFRDFDIEENCTSCELDDILEKLKQKKLEADKYIDLLKNCETPFTIVFDNGGGTTFFTEDYCHHFSDPDDFRESLKSFLEYPYCYDWDGDESDLYDIDDDDIHHCENKIFTLHDLQDLDFDNLEGFIESCSGYTERCILQLFL